MSEFIYYMNNSGDERKEPHYYRVNTQTGRYQWMRWNSDWKDGRVEFICLRKAVRDTCVEISEDWLLIELIK